MKLPALTNAPVERLTLKNPEVAAAKGRALSSAAGAIGDITKKIAIEKERKTTAVESVTSQTASRERALSTLQGYSSPFMSTNDPKLAGATYDETQVKTDAEGNSWVPTSLVSSELLEKDLAAIYAEESAKLTTEEAKDQYEVYWAELSTKTRFVAQAQEAKNMKLSNLADYQDSLNKAMTRGDFAEAGSILETSYHAGAIDKATYQEKKYSLAVTSEKIQLLEIRESDDPEIMREAAASLDSEDYNGALSYPTRVELANKLEDDAERLENEAINLASTSAVNAYKSLLLIENPQAADVQLLEASAKELRDTEYDGPIESLDARRQLADQMEAKASESILSAAAQEKQETERAVSDVQIGISSPYGQSTVFDVEALFAKGQISGAQRSTMTEQIANKNTRMVEASAFNLQIESIAASGGVVPITPETRKAVDAKYNSRVQAGEPPLEVGMDIMRSYKMMPEAIKGVLRGANRADAADLGEAGAIYAAGLRLAPGSMKDLTGESVELVSRVAANINMNMTPAQAVASVLAWDALSPSDRDARTKQMQMHKKNNVAILADFVSSSEKFDVPWTTTDGNVGQRMQSRFDALVEQYLPLGGSLGEAQSRAFGDIRTSYSMTDVNGDYEYMLHAPQGDPVAIRRSIDSAYGPGVKIQSDTLTELQVNNGDAPTYRVFREEDALVDMPKHSSTSKTEDGLYSPHSWQGAFQVNTGTDPAAIGIDTRDQAELYVNTLFSNGPVELDRFSYSAEEELQRENGRIVSEAKTTFNQRADFDARLLDSKIAREVSKGVPIREKEAYLKSEEAKIKKGTYINNLLASGGIDRGQAQGTLRRLGLGNVSQLPVEKMKAEQKELGI